MALYSFGSLHHVLHQHGGGHGADAAGNGRDGLNDRLDLVKLGVAGNAALAATSRFLFLGVKPGMIRELATEISSSVSPGTVLVSMLAGVSLSRLELGAEQTFDEGIDLHALCAEAVRKTAVLCENRGLTVEYENTHITVRTDGDLLDAKPRPFSPSNTPALDRWVMQSTSFLGSRRLQISFWSAFRCLGRGRNISTPWMESSALT
ncbi:MAG: hypothetical protein BHW31_02955 [Firmicutes bacterium CAG:110_56_8]|nr:MAG: hypothetical protein BHW31_02955 [Firmicutes bacterium CAG:110_56_8]